MPFQDTCVNLEFDLRPSTIRLPSSVDEIERQERYETICPNVRKTQRKNVYYTILVYVCNLVGGYIFCDW